MPGQEYLTEDQVVSQVGEDGLDTLYRWLRDKEYINWEQVDDTRFKRSEKFITKEQLSEFIKEQLTEFKGEADNINLMLGQTKEFLKTHSKKKKK